MRVHINPRISFNLQSTISEESVREEERNGCYCGVWKGTGKAGKGLEELRRDWKGWKELGKNEKG